MRTAEVEFRFPVLAFTRDGALWGFQDLERLTKCGPRTLKENSQDGMELIDAGRRRWLVRSISRTGRAGSLLSLFLPFGPPQSRIEHQLEPLAEVTMEEVQRRAVASLDADAEDYTYSDEDKAEFAKLRRDVGRAETIAKVYDLIQPDTFEPN